MNTDRELMQQALEALDGTEALLSSMDVTHLLIYGEVEKAITALREALEQPEQDGWHTHDLYTDADKDRPDVICDRNGSVTLGLCKRCGRGESQLAEPCDKQPVQEPVARGSFVVKDGCVTFPMSINVRGMADGEYSIYTAPQPEQQPRREWQGLTDGEIDALAMDEDGLPNSHIELARAIERAHGIGEKPDAA